MINPHIILWSLGILQPCTDKEIYYHLLSIYPNLKELYLLKDFSKSIYHLEDRGLITPSSDDQTFLKSLTFAGSAFLNKDLRHSRDKSRLFLLNRARKFSRYSHGGSMNLAGDSPVAEGSSSEQGRRPMREVVGSSTLPHWPSTFKQLDISAGSFRPPCKYLPLYSFSSFSTLHAASGSDADNENDLRLRDLALAIGISPHLITSIINDKERHYRSFTIKKRSGGTRQIDAPRIFLKVIQAWINDYILRTLPQSANCHSYIRGRSILSNSQPHTQKEYVANIDIQDFFNSINKLNLRKSLSTYYSSNMSTLISKLCTLKDSLPQGSPASPTLSNYYLRFFDKTINNESIKYGCSFTRYADDITISSHNKDNIVSIISLCEKELLKIDLRLNTNKTRIASKHGQQKVTGLVVNTIPSPPRKYRRTIRSLLHNAGKSPSDYRHKIAEISGHISYLESFPHLKDSAELVKYRILLRKLTEQMALAPE